MFYFQQVLLICTFHSSLLMSSSLTFKGSNFKETTTSPWEVLPLIFLETQVDYLAPDRSQRLLQNGTENVHKGQTPTSQQYISKLFYAERSPNLRRQECKHVFLILCFYLKLPLLKRKLTCFSSTSQECRNLSRGEKLSLK